MIGSIFLALVLWAAFVLLSLYLVSRIARTRMTSLRKDMQVHFILRRCRKADPASSSKETVIDEK